MFITPYDQTLVQISTGNLHLGEYGSILML